MEKTFSLRGIFSEIKRVKWPSLKDTAKNTGSVILFSALFAAFFAVCDLIAQLILRVI